MGLADRLAAGTTVVVLGTSLLVGGGSLLWISRAQGEWPVGLVVAQVGLTCVAMLGAHGVVRQVTMPVLTRLRRLARDIRNVASSQDPREIAPPPDEEAGSLARAVNHLLQSVRAEREEIRRQSLERRLVLEMSSQGILVVDGDEGRIRYANPFFRRVLTLRGAPEGRLPIEAIPVAEIQEAVDHVLGGDPSVELHAATGTRDLLVRAVRLETGDVLVMVDDVTEFRDAERSRADFVANVSHELRTPVSAIMGYAETMLADRERIPDDLVPLLETIDRNARRLRDLFEDLLRLHRIEARKRAFPLRRMALLPVLEGAVVSAADNAARKGQEFRLECDPGLEASINPEALGTIVGNLASNASNYTHDGGTIVVRARRDGPDTVIDVVDNGIGIAPAHHERVFERFFRVDEARSRKAGGTGLGLAIVKHLALATGMRVTLESEPGRGSTFSIRIPGGGREA